MSSFPEDFPKDPFYSDACNFSPTFYSKFKREGLRNFVCIENKQIAFKAPLEYERKDNLHLWWKEAKEAKVLQNYNFQNVETRLSNKKVKIRKNEDLREFLYFENYFLVKKFFTFGFQTVPKNMYHIITTTVKPLDVYTPNSRLNFPNGYFDNTMEYLFNKVTLDAHRTYLLRPGDQYLVITIEKCIFLFRELFQENMSDCILDKKNGTKSNLVQIFAPNHFITPLLETVTPDLRTFTPEFGRITPGLEILTPEIITSTYEPVTP